MTTMLEKMARAMRDSEPGMEGKSWRYWLPSARAALQAIREPDTSVRMASVQAWSDDETETPVTRIWQAMIDAILAEDKA